MKQGNKILLSQKKNNKKNSSLARAQRTNGLLISNRVQWFFQGHPAKENGVWKLDRSKLLSPLFITLWWDSPALRIKSTVFLTPLSSAESSTSPSPPSPPATLNGWHFPEHSMPCHTCVLKPIVTSAWTIFPFFLCLAKFHLSFKTWFKLRLPLPRLSSSR